MVFRCFAEKRPGFDGEALGLTRELTHQLGVKGLTGVRILNRYDVEGIDRATFEAAGPIVFSEPQVDWLYEEEVPLPLRAGAVLVVEALPGQYDQRADSAAQCIQLMAGGERPVVRSATVYLLEGALRDEELERVKTYLINPVERRQTGPEKPDTLAQNHDQPGPVAVLEGFTDRDEAGLGAMAEEYGLAMDVEDLKFLQAYFREGEGRQPTLTELRLVDTYWSDHCRHTTFSTHIDAVEVLDKRVAQAYQDYLAAREEVYGPQKAAKRPQTLMDIATIGAKTLKKRGLLQNLDESEEINACSVRVKAEVDGVEEDWLLMFKNETHNHPTEIEPFGGAATCVGGAIRDPLSGRAYVYQAMRVTGCGDPTLPLEQTLPGKLPQRTIAATAAAGYASYGNQIGLATGVVSEVYHPGYIAKHMEVGAVVGAAPAANVVREVPQPGDRIILLGGRTGRDGIGGATGSSKSHNSQSLEKMASEVQKGNAPEERKIQRLFRRGEVTRLIKRCNDFGAGGVSVAIGELAPGLEIDLSLVRKKYEGLDGTELAISESQERMAVVVASENVDTFLTYAASENLEAYEVAKVTALPRLKMTWNGAVVADLSRAFLDTNGVDKHTCVQVPDYTGKQATTKCDKSLRGLAGSLTHGLQRGLVERFDSTIGAASVLVPFGGVTQSTPAQVMAALLPVEPGKRTNTCSVMAYGFDPRRMESDPYGGAAASVVESIAKLVAAGCAPGACYLSLQEYFEKLREEPARWGKPFAALLGALSAQLGLGVAAIGGKDSMSGSFLDLDVPPTLISFAIAPQKAENVLSPEFKTAGRPVYLFAPPLGDWEQTRVCWEQINALCKAGRVEAAWAVGTGGVAEGIMKMSFGNRIGFLAQEGLEVDWYGDRPGAVLVQTDGPLDQGTLMGITTAKAEIFLGGETVDVDELRLTAERVLEGVYPTQTPAERILVPTLSHAQRAPIVARSRVSRPRAVIPVFPGTNCEYDTAAACMKAGIQPEILVVRNSDSKTLGQSALALEKAIRASQMVILPGGFSGGDEPEGSAKFICAFLRNAAITDAIHDLLRNRDGLMLGICNGFQALIKLGLATVGEIRPMDDRCPTLTFNRIGRHQSRYVHTRVASVQSPWMLHSQVGDIHAIPVSHGEGRFVAPADVVEELIAQGQVATQYVDAQGNPSMDIGINPNGSVMAIEGLFSPDGRVFGKMGHSERFGPHIGKNIPGEKHQPLFESGAEYYR